jgi:hypothetical protein
MYGYGATGTNTTSEALEFAVQVTNNAGGSVEVMASPGVDGPGTTPVTPGVAVPAGMAYIYSTARSLAGNRHVRSVGELVAVTSAGGLFQAAIESVGAVTLSGSANTNYFDSGGSSTANGGSIVSVHGPFNLSGGALVRGNVSGPGATSLSAQYFTGQAQQVPTSTSFLNLQPAPPSPVPAPAPIVLSGSLLALPPGSYGDVTVQGSSSLTLQAGTYVFNNVDVSGGGAAIIIPADVTGPVKVYFYGSFNAAGGSTGNVVNSTRLAADFQVFQAGNSTTGRSVQLSGGSGVYLTMDAPTLPVTLSGNSNITGSLIGGTVTMTGNGTVIYDEALSTAAAGASVSIVNYRRF